MNFTTFTLMPARLIFDNVCLPEDIVEVSCTNFKSGGWGGEHFVAPTRQSFRFVRACERKRGRRARDQLRLPRWFCRMMVFFVVSVRARWLAVVLARFFEKHEKNTAFLYFFTLFHALLTFFSHFHTLSRIFMFFHALFSCSSREKAMKNEKLLEMGRQKSFSSFD